MNTPLLTFCIGDARSMLSPSELLSLLQAGLKALSDDGKVFNCYTSIHDVIYHAELGSSAAIFRAGYTIDSLMLRYKGVNWTDPQNHNCNAGCAPNLASPHRCAFMEECRSKCTE